jgi:hypothetical protein
MEAIEVIRKRVNWCESEGVEILCCPEAILGGLADYTARPADIAIDVESGQLGATLPPLASDTVTTILGFTEITGTGQLYNSAANPEANRNRVLVYNNSLLLRFGRVWVCRGDLPIEQMSNKEMLALNVRRQ